MKVMRSRVLMRMRMARRKKPIYLSIQKIIKLPITMANQSRSKAPGFYSKNPSLLKRLFASSLLLQ